MATVILSKEKLLEFAKNPNVTYEDIVKIIRNEWDVEPPKFSNKEELVCWFYDYFETEKEKELKSGMTLHNLKQTNGIEHGNY